MIAFVCSSPVQVMRAINMRTSCDWCKGEADIYITRKCAGYEKIYRNLKNENLFNEVFCMNVETLGNHIVFQLIFGRNQYSKVIKSRKYEKIIAFNIEDELTQALFNLNRRNKGFQYHCVEDCPNIYPIYEPAQYSLFHPFKWVGIDKQAFHIHTWWCSCPEFVCVPKSFGAKVEKLPIIDINDKKYLDVVNRVFEFKYSNQLDEADILIMDEAFYQDGLMVDSADEKIFNTIKEEFESKKVLIKMHPRTKNNRYEGKLEVMGCSEFPWELYLLNRMSKNDSKKLIQVGIACGTLVSDLFMFGEEGKKIVLAPLFMDKLKVPQNGTPLITDDKINNYLKIKQMYFHPNDFVVVKSEDEIFKSLRRMLEE